MAIGLPDVSKLAEIQNMFAGFKNAGVDFKSLPIYGATDPLNNTKVNRAAPVSMVNGKIFYSNPDVQVFSGNSDRPSYVFQDWNNTDWMRQNTQAYTYKNPITGEDQNGFLIDPSIVNDPNFGVKTVDTYRGKADHSGPLNDIASIAGIASMFIPGMQPFAAMANIGAGAATGNLGQSLSGAFGLPGVGGAVNSYVGSGLNSLGVAKDIIPYATKGLLSAGTTVASGGSLTDALKTGLATGGGMYGGSQVGGLLKDYKLPASVTQGLQQAAAGSIGAAVKGGDIGKAALYSGLSGAASGLGRDITSGMDNGWQKDILQAAPGIGLKAYQFSQTPNYGAPSKQQQLMARMGSQPTNKRAQLAARLASMRA